MEVISDPVQKEWVAEGCDLVSSLAERAGDRFNQFVIELRGSHQGRSIARVFVNHLEWIINNSRDPVSQDTREIFNNRVAALRALYIQPGGHQEGFRGRTIQWVPAAGNGRVPGGAVIGGIEGNDSLLVARGHLDNAVIPGKYHVGHGTCYVPYGGEEKTPHSFEILTAPAEAVSWVRAHNGAIPGDMIPVPGHSKNREPYYVGRAIFNGTVTVGKVHHSHQCCYISYGGKEHKILDYEVLVKNMFGAHIRA